MSAAIAAISKLAIVKTSSIAPHYAPFRPQTRTLKFPHQEIGIKQEDDKAYLDHRPPDIFLHPKKSILLATSIDRHEKVFSVTWVSKLHRYRSSRENTSHRRCPPTEMQELSEVFGNDVRRR